MKKLFLLFGVVALLYSCVREPMDSGAPDEELYQQASDQRSLGNLSAAESLYRQLLAEFPTSLKWDNALVALADCLREEGRREESVQTLRSLGEGSALYEEAIYTIPNVMQEDAANYLPDSVITAWRHYLSEFPNGRWTAEAIYGVGQSFYGGVGSFAPARISWYDSAATWFDSVQTRFPESSIHFDAKYRLGWTRWQQSQWRAAADAFLGYADSLPTGSYADGSLYWGGKALANLNDGCGALDAFQRLLTEYPGSNDVASATAEMQGLECIP